MFYYVKFLIYILGEFNMKFLKKSKKLLVIYITFKVIFTLILFTVGVKRLDASNNIEISEMIKYAMYDFNTLHWHNIEVNGAIWENTIKAINNHRHYSIFFENKTDTAVTITYTSSNNLNQDRSFTVQPNSTRTICGEYIDTITNMNLNISNNGHENLNGLVSLKTSKNPFV
jgi:hypothetical protein